VKAAYLTGHGDNEVVAVGERLRPARGAGEVLVRVRGSSHVFACHAYGLIELLRDLVVESSIYSHAGLASDGLRRSCASV